MEWYLVCEAQFKMLLQNKFLVLMIALKIAAGCEQCKGCIMYCCIHFVDF